MFHFLFEKLTFWWKCPLFYAYHGLASHFFLNFCMKTRVFLVLSGFFVRGPNPHAIFENELQRRDPCFPARAWISLKSWAIWE